MAIKMRDVARYAAVSVATVSRALNDPSKVNEETRQRVFEAVAALGYRLNSTARSLRTQRTYNIAVVFSSMMYAPFLQAIETVALEYGYTLLLCTTQDDPARTQRYIELLRQQQRVDGICWMSPRVSGESLAPLLEGDTPLLLINAPQAQGLLALDYAQATAGLTRYLMEKGHERIALLNLDDPNFPPAQWRTQGYQQAHQAAGLALNPALLYQVPTAPLDHAAWDTAIEQMLHSEPRPTAVITFNDLVAARLYQACTHLGIRIPQELAIAGVGDFPIATMLHPPLTTARFPVAEISRTAIELLLEMIANGTPPDPYTVYFPPTLVERAST